MKKQIITLFLFSFITGSLFAQLSKGDVQVLQDYFGVEKTIMIKEYMGFSAEQDSLFWPIYKEYEQARLDIGKDRFANIEEYLKNVQNISGEKASELVNKSVGMEMQFKKLQKKYFKTLSKKIGPVKAAQFYQFENYLNNIINISIQQSIPFVGDLEQKYGGMPKK